MGSEFSELEAGGDVGAEADAGGEVGGGGKRRALAL
jgi:hypothetical protein